MKITKIITLGLLVSLLVGIAAYAATPAQIYSEITGVTEEEAYELREEGKSFGQLAEEQGVLEEFQAKMLEDKIALIEERVEEGSLTREEADAFIAQLKENVANCDPSNPQKIGQKNGLNRGTGKGMGQGGCGGGRGNRNGGKGLGVGRRAN